MLPGEQNSERAKIMRNLQSGFKRSSLLCKSQGARPCFLRFFCFFRLFSTHFCLEKTKIRPLQLLAVLSMLNCLCFTSRSKNRILLLAANWFHRSPTRMGHPTRRSRASMLWHLCSRILLFHSKAALANSSGLIFQSRYGAHDMLRKPILLFNQQNRSKTDCSVHSAVGRSIRNSLFWSQTARTDSSSFFAMIEIAFCLQNPFARSLPYRAPYSGLKRTARQADSISR